MRLYAYVTARLVVTVMLMYMTPTIIGVKLGTLHPMSLFLVGLGVFVYSGIGLRSVAVRPNLVRSFILADLRDQESDFMIFAFWPPMLFVTGFVVLCHSLAMLRPELLVESSRGLVSEIEWVLFGVDQVARVVLLDFFEIFYIHVSAVRPTNWFWLNIIIFVFRTGMTLYLVRLVISVYTSWPHPQRS